jgi:hypothetical protein
MNAFIFVSILCIGQQCDFMTSSSAVTQVQCQQMKKEFLNAKFKPEVTMAATQCLDFKNEPDNKVKVWL